MPTETELRDKAKTSILKTRKAIKEFRNYPRPFLNKLFGLRYNLSDPFEKQVRDWVAYEKKNSREDTKFDTIVLV